MKLHEFLQWVAKLPKEALQYEIVSSKFGQLTEDKNYRLDMPIISLSIDEKNNEVILEVKNDK